MLAIKNVAIKGISCVVPTTKINNVDLSQVYGDKETLKLISSIGVESRYVVDETTTSADLCLQAARQLLLNLKWDVQDIGALIFVSQTPDYQLPATACILQHKLGLPETVMAFDINLGCSGYVYGLNVAASLVNSGIKKVLLLVGDTISKIVKPGDRSTELLFGDAGSATALQYEDNKLLQFELGSNGSGWENIVARNQISSDVNRGANNAFLEMNGGEVFTFTLKTVPALVNKFLQELSLSSSDIDACIYHQANHFMLKHLAKKSNFLSEQVAISINEYGNTSCASIPVTLCARKRENYKNTLLIGFGVGLSWGAVMCDLSESILLPVEVLINDN
ncbi:3-oxoacyl-[acyl-carrier-protein] synthase-3 [Aeromonas sp. BIGb0405]|uniref:ketoacyl-ACP synthase III n=1 Tax=Aeromonas sp. BIGb0405 TaxID=2940592 RepID=UPI00216900AB|nr:ketoacyl-ACP synthase III [Aeromonas sp. BIGb0405]MCS3455400.1 3-oxoacyl-[acyl-carrier-protein] synthase-3 [Aeromonas sp. BIGb0405]